MTRIIWLGLLGGSILTEQGSLSDIAPRYGDALMAGVLATSVIRIENTDLDEHGSQDTGSSGSRAHNPIVASSSQATPPSH